MKSILTATAVAIAAATPVFAFYPLGNDAELFVTGDVSIEHNSNIFLSSSARSDTILTFAPGLQIPFGQNSALKGQLTASEEFQLYTSQDDLNDELAHLNLTAGFDDGKARADFGASYNQINSANRATAGGATIARRDVTHLNAIGEISVTAKSSISAGVVWDDTSYKLAGYVDLETFEVPLKYYYKATPQVDLAAGLRYRKNNLALAGADSDETFYSLGARGDLLPKLTGEFAIGYQERSPDVGSDDSGLGLESDFTYAATEKSTVMFGLNRTFGYSGSGSGYDITGGNLGFRVDAQEDLTVDGNLSYTKYDYISSTRSDDFYSARIGGTYLVNAFVSLTGSVAYTKNESNLAGSSFNATVFKLGASIRY